MAHSQDPPPSSTKAPPSASLSGTLVAGRFLIEAPMDRGGMGTVYRAQDQLTGQRVAVKLLHAEASEESLRRFLREAGVLASLQHPAIVSHVAHGTSEGGQPFLAMEWLEGENLASRLEREPLSLAQTLALMRRVTPALVLAHSRGVVHRDIKPSNLFLRAGRPEDVVLLDFGLARHVAPSVVMTASNVVLGTLGYMAPEQASSEGDITPSADLFSLGCVLYECLTGQPPFAAPHTAAVLAKILFAEPAPLRSLRPELPEVLQAVMDRLLAKEPMMRFPDAAALQAEFKALEASPGVEGPAHGAGPHPAYLPVAEQQLVSVLLAAPPSPPHGPSEALSTGELRDSIRATLAPLKAQVELLADGSLVAALMAGRGTASDQAALAARCALALKERWHEANVVLATGRGTLSQHLPVGEAMDRAGQLLRQLGQLPASASAHVLLDEVSAGLLGPYFQLARPESGLFLLQGENLSADASRPLLGKPTPCVGREQELALLEATFTTCVEEPSAQAVLVVASAGTGKSRLCHEFLRRLEQREHPVRVLMCRGDPLSAGAAFGLLGQALRLHCGIRDGESLEERRERLSQRVARYLPADRAQELAEFLGELCSLPFPDEHSPRLRAARIDPKGMATQVSRALVAFLQAECVRQPVLLVLEDLHWADALTVKLVGEALHGLAEQPFMVLALARPEIRELFPRLWPQVQELPLRGLSHKAGSRLVHEVLGTSVSRSRVERILEQAAGNALFLEELIRRVAEGRGEAPPETVLAMLQTRLLRLEPGARQVLLAASLFGRVFWAGGVRALLGPGSSSGELEYHLRNLVEQELIEPQPSSRFAAEAEYRFRHALQRDAAYGLVPDSNKLLGHRLASTWLEQAGETAPLVLAEHYHLGQCPERAIDFYIRACEQLLERHDVQGTLRYVGVALALGARGAALTRLRALEAMGAFWVNDMARAYASGRAALPELKAGSSAWCRLIGYLVLSSASVGRKEDMPELVRLMLSTQPEVEALPIYAEGISIVASIIICTGDRSESAALMARMLEFGADARDPMTLGWMSLVQGLFDYFFEDRPWRALQGIERGVSAFLEVDSERNASILRLIGGFSRASLGDVPGAVEQLRELMATAQRLDQHSLVASARAHLARILANHPHPSQRQEARALALDQLAEAGTSLNRGMAHTALARLAAHEGDLAEAEAQAIKACEVEAPFLSYQLFSQAVLCAVLRAQGRLGEAREAAALGVQELERMGGTGVHSVPMHLELAEACFAQGDTQAGDASLSRALQHLRKRATDVEDMAVRERFLQQVSENVRTLELARQRWGGQPQTSTRDGSGLQPFLTL